MVGAAWRWRLAPRWHLSAGAMAGVQLHAFQASAPLVASKGVRLDGLFLFPAELAWGLWERWELAARLAPGVSTRSRLHTDGSTELWQRSSARLELGLNLLYFFD